MDKEKVIYSRSQSFTSIKKEPPRLLYVSSFNRRLWKFTGHALVESFLNTQTKGELLLTYEDDIKSQIKQKIHGLSNKHSLRYYNLDEDEFLQIWLKNNIDIIPQDLGGTAAKCNCVDNDHIRGCPYSFFNYRASQWFRKVVALNYAIKLDTYDILVFIDCDAEFRKKTSIQIIKDTFKNKLAMWYFLGRHRKALDKGIEAGFMGFHRQYGGYDIIQLLIDKYVSGDFKQYHRWDDGYVLRMVVEENPQIPTKDLTEYVDVSRVMDEGPFRKYIAHKKGIHEKQGIRLLELNR